ncbi:MAG TPA: hypothetical protein VMW35_10525 [Myxococcota bacterium]|nr:hypothetical protein [Myxococcota bacterium]
MIDALALFAALATWAVSTVLAVRLVALSRRTGEAAELWVGLAYLLASGVGVPPFILANHLRVTDPVAAQLWLLVALGGFLASCVALSLGVWRTFRATSRWPLAIVLVVAVAAARAFLAALRSDPGRVPASGIAAGAVAFSVALSWAALESLSLASVLRRRASIGLASPEVHQRVRLWGIAALLTLANATFGTAMYFLYGTNVPVVTTRLVQTAFTLLVTAATWISFFPPERVRRWMRSRAASIRRVG